MWNFSKLAILGVVLSCQASSQEVATPWVTRELPNGVTVHALEEPSAPRQTTFTFLPVGLESDPAGRAQFAHLAEHMMIRSTDPKRLQVAGITINGETTGQGMRLESFAEPGHWEAALRRHARWLTAREFDAATLAREKVRIEGEERGTVPRGYNHKWATAAWSQFMGGREHAAVHGDVAGATVEQVADYVNRRVVLAEACIFIIGPRSAAEQFTVLEAEFAALTKERAGATKETPLPAPGEQNLPAIGHHERTWDLQAHHYLEWYALPEACNRLEAQMLAQVVSVACYQQPTLRALPGSGLAASAWSGGRGYLLFSANLPEKKGIDEICDGFGDAIDQAVKFVRLQVNGARMVEQLFTKPDFAKQREQVRSPRVKNLVEGQFAMNLGYGCLRSRLPLGELRSAYRTLDAKRLVRYLESSCGEKLRISVRLAPKK